MAAESWYGETPEQATARRREVMRERLSEMGRFKNTPRPPETPRPDGLPTGSRATRDEVDLLLAQAQEELALGTFEDDVARPEQIMRRRMAVFCTDPRMVCMGIIETLRWVTSQRDSAPVTGEVYDFPLSREATGREMMQAKDAMEKLGPFHSASRDQVDYGAGAYQTIRWVRDPSSRRPLNTEPGLPPGQ